MVADDDAAADINVDDDDDDDDIADDAVGIDAFVIGCDKNAGDVLAATDGAEHTPARVGCDDDSGAEAADGDTRVPAIGGFCCENTFCAAAECADGRN